MNKRITELWTKAAESTAAYPTGQNNSWETQVNFMEKFAELIVRECAQVCAKIELDEELSAEADIWDGAMMCRVEIMEHFGVEE